MSIYDKASLVLIPSGSKTSKVYSQKPTNGDGDFTFSRSTAATRVNASGNIEKETQNLLLHSNSFDTTWTNITSTETSGQADKDGGTNAWLISKTNSAGRISQSVSSSGVNTASVYAKAGTLNWMVVVCGTQIETYFDLSTGSVGGSGSNVIDTNVENVGNGWYRCSFSYNGTGTTFNIYPADGNFDVSGTSGNIVIQDAQLEQGLVARDYIETTTTAIYGGITDNVPRLDYQGSCPALLLEPQRQNLNSHSEYFNNGNGWSITRISVEHNNATSPEGVQNASKLIATTDNLTHFLYDGFSGTSGNDYTLSLFVKADEYDHIEILPSTSGGVFNGSASLFDATNGTWDTTGTDTTTTSTDMGDGWYRITLTQEAQATAFSLFIIRLHNGTSNTFAGNGTDGILIYGAQVEEGSYATSYIPTYGSAVTRNADSMNISSIADEIDGNTFTYFIEVNNKEVVRDTSQGSISLGQSGNRLFIYNAGTSASRMRLYIQDGTTQTYDLSADNVKLAVRIEPNKVEVFENGVSVLSTTQNLDFSANSYYSLAGANRTISIKKTVIFPTALTDQEAIDLTTI